MTERCARRLLPVLRTSLYRAVARLFNWIKTRAARGELAWRWVSGG
jgi:hypothetical protein